MAKKGTKGRKNSLQNTTQKTKDRATQTTQNNRSERRCSGRVLKDEILQEAMIHDSVDACAK
jgi:hypothetical protein